MTEPGSAGAGRIRGPRRAVAAAVLVAAAVVPGSAPAAGSPPPADTAGPPALLYVCNQGDATISVVGMESRELVRTIDLREEGFSANAKPHHVAVEPDGSHFYVSLIGANRILRFTRDGELVADAAFEVPGLLALDVSSDVLYAGRSMSAVDPPKRVGRFEIPSLDPEELGVFFPRPHAMAVDPRTGWVYTASLAQNRIAAVRPADGTVELVGVDGPPHTIVDFAVSPDGGTLVATTQLTGKLLFFDLREPGRPVFVGAVDVGGQPWHPVFSPDGSRVYVPVKEDDAVAIVDAGERRVVDLVRGRGLSQPHGSAVSPDGGWLFVSGNNLDGAYRPTGAPPEGDPVGTVTVIDADSGAIADVIEVGHYPSGIGARPPR